MISFKQYHEPNQWQQAILDRLLSIDFPGRTELFQQLNSALVLEIDNNGTLNIKVFNRIKAAVQKRVPIEAQVLDSDGMMIHFLLHVQNGIAKELEIYKDDSSKLLTIPSPESLEVILLGV